MSRIYTLDNLNSKKPSSLETSLFEVSGRGFQICRIQWHRFSGNFEVCIIWVIHGKNTNMHKWVLSHNLWRLYTTELETGCSWSSKLYILVYAKWRQFNLYWIRRKYDRFSRLFFCKVSWTLPFIESKRHAEFISYSFYLLSFR